MRETCAQFWTRSLVFLFGLPDTLRPAYLPAFKAVLSDVRVATNRTEAEILICAKPSCNIWHEQRIMSGLGIGGSKRLMRV
eukprot:10514967-Alexandrium_andersonii.AAC.1